MEPTNAGKSATAGARPGPVTRRGFTSGMAAALGGLAIAGCANRSSRLAHVNRPLGYGPTLPDPAGLIDLPSAFSLWVVWRLGGVVGVGLVVGDRAGGRPPAAVEDAGRRRRPSVAAVVGGGGRHSGTQGPDPGGPSWGLRARVTSLADLSCRNHPEDPQCSWPEDPSPDIGAIEGLCLGPGTATGCG